MPKIISRTSITTSNETDQEADVIVTPNSGPSLRVFYCLCGDFALVIDRPLSSLAIRPLDGSHVLRNIDSTERKRATYKITARQGEVVLLRRQDGTVEKQYHFNCSRCNLPLGYEVTPPPLKSGPFTYLFPGALTEVQGNAPDNALLGE